MNKKQIKMLLENDYEVLKKAYESDTEMINVINKLLSVHLGEIYNILKDKGIITEDEEIEYLAEAKEILESKGEEDG